MSTEDDEPASDEELEKRLDALRPEVEAYFRQREDRRRRIGNVTRSAAADISTQALGTALGALIVYLAAVVAGLLRGERLIAALVLAAVLVPLVLALTFAILAKRAPKPLREFEALNIELEYRELAGKLSRGEVFTFAEEQMFDRLGILRREWNRRYR